jgi:beta-ureidopropionase / N-carbamoyl-L-amino-acid hydrolase
MPVIDGQRVVADLRRLAEFGRYKTGVHRPTYSPVDVESRHWLAGKLGEAGLEPVIDGIGNVIGRNPRARRLLLVGSHSETQPYGGWLDGALGVIYGLELARAVAADPDCAGLGIEVAAWADEEGHYGGYLGSRFIGALGEEEIDQARSRDDDTPLREALARAGFAGRPCGQFEPGRHIGYLEAHIEQGDALDTSGLRIGVVEGIVGIRNFRVSLIGEQNHAGTTRMIRRKDAGVAMVRLATRIHDRFPEIAGPARYGRSAAYCSNQMRPRLSLVMPKCRFSSVIPTPIGSICSRKICTGSPPGPTAADPVIARSRRSGVPSRGRWIRAFGR